MPLPFARTFAGLLAVVALAAGGPRPAVAQQAPVLTRLNSPSITVRAGTSKLLRVQLTASGRPLPGFQVDWQILSTTAGATGPASSVTDAQGIASASFDFPRAGVTRIRALVAQAGVPLSVDYTVTSVNPPPPPPTETRLVLQPAGATSLAAVLGDRVDFAVVLRSASGAPAPGVLVRFTVEPSPGAPGVFPQSDRFASTGSDGIATTSFDFSMVGSVTLRATSADPAFVFEPASIDFTVEVDSLSALVPGRRTWRSAAEALDAICLDVFVDPQGNPRPVPRLAPLCTYMTSALGSRDERTAAIVALTPTGLAAQTATALAGIEGVRGSVHSRLTALRGGGTRAAVDRLALAVDGTEISNDALAAAERDGARFSVFSRRLEESFARLYAGLDAGDQPAAAPAAPQVAARRERPWGFFATGRLTRGDRSRGVEVDAFDFDTAGVTAGFDRALAANGFLGFALTGLRNRTDLAGGGGQLDADTWAATLYGIHEGRKGYLQATATWGRSRYDQRRRLALPVVGDLTARADFDGDQLAADLELGRSIDGRAGSLTAFVRGSWARAAVDAFRERGAVAPLPVPGTGFGAVDFGVALDRQELESLVGAGGLDWGRAFSIPGGLVIPQLTATWSHEFDADAERVRATFLGDTAAAAAFFVFTDPPDRDWLTASAALRFQYLWGSFFVSYDHELMRDDLELRTANAGLRFEF